MTSSNDIRAAFLDDIRKAYTADPELANLLVDPYFSSKLAVSQVWGHFVTCTPRSRSF